jgi:glycosidase
VDEGGQGISPRRLLVNFLDNHDVGRFRYLYDDTPAHHNALFYLLTQDGIPCLYYGTEQRFTGGNDPANREDLWLSGFDRSNGTFRTIQTLIALRKKYAPLRRGDFAVRWSTQERADGAGEDAGIFAFERTHAGETVLVVVNTSNTKTANTRSGTYVMSTAFPAGTNIVNVFCMEGEGGDHGAHECSAQERQSGRVAVGPNGAVTLSVPPRSGMILVRE